MKPSALILAPHPDDESIVGLLPLRLRAECGYRIWVAPVTFGSCLSRQGARKKELQSACKALGFQLRFLNSEAIAADLCKLLERVQPSVVFLPHAKDGHPTHRTTHRLAVAAMDALRPAVFQVVETEYWHPLERPNLMVAASKAQLATLCRALACHKGEMVRNDYAARLPAWMIDNVRRGAELIGGAGAAAPNLAFATLYRARKRINCSWKPEFRAGRIIESSADLRKLAARWT